MAAAYSCGRSPIRPVAPAATFAVGFLRLTQRAGLGDRCRTIVAGNEPRSAPPEAVKSRFSVSTPNSRLLGGSVDSVSELVTRIGARASSRTC
jgi:hypothetical protein